MNIASTGTICGSVGGFSPRAALTVRYRFNPDVCGEAEQLFFPFPTSSWCDLDNNRMGFHSGTTRVS